MRINIRSLSFKLTNAIRRHAEHRAASLLETLRDRNAGAVVSLNDVNGNRGGVDKSCRITVRSPRWGPMIVEAVDRDLYSAIDRAYTRLRRSVRRRMDRRRAPHRHAHRHAETYSFMSLATA